MQAPVISGYRALEPAPRRFLFFVAVNVVSWQNIVGPAMVLFARKIDMPEFLVGLLLSIMPFAQLLVLVTMPMLLGAVSILDSDIINLDRNRCLVSCGDQILEWNLRTSNCVCFLYFCAFFYIILDFPNRNAMFKLTRRNARPV